MSPILTIRTGLLLCAALIFAPAADAALVNFNTSGTWQNAPGVSGFNGAGTNQINWGTPLTSSGQSGWRFDGNAGQVDTDVNDGLFQVGTFTHNNFIISNANFLGTTLDLTVTIDGVDLDLALGLTHLETPNFDSPCAAGGAQPCPDLVSFPGVDQVFFANGRDYRITGFVDLNGTAVNNFLTLENQVNTAALYARLDDITKPPPPLEATPEPGTLLLFGAGCLLFGRLRKRG